MAASIWSSLTSFANQTAFGDKFALLTGQLDLSASASDFGQAVLVVISELIAFDRASSACFVCAVAAFNVCIGQTERSLLGGGFNPQAFQLEQAVKAAALHGAPRAVLSG